MFVRLIPVLNPRWVGKWAVLKHVDLPLNQLWDVAALFVFIFAITWWVLLTSKNKVLADCSLGQSAINQRAIPVYRFVVFVYFVRAVGLICFVVAHLFSRWLRVNDDWYEMTALCCTFLVSWHTHTSLLPHTLKTEVSCHRNQGPGCYGYLEWTSVWGTEK